MGHQIFIRQDHTTLEQQSMTPLYHQTTIPKSQVYASLILILNSTKVTGANDKRYYYVPCGNFVNTCHQFFFWQYMSSICALVLQELQN